MTAPHPLVTILTPMALLAVSYASSASLITMASSGPVLERIEAWKVVSVILGSALISCVILYMVVRFGTRGWRA